MRSRESLEPNSGPTKNLAPSHARAGAFACAGFTHANSDGMIIWAEAAFADRQRQTAQSQLVFRWEKPPGGGDVVHGSGR